ncbi:MAG: growth-arrest-specific micro-tubule binding-domain-containing protein [Monoraphidium minutum]|nr:MAG: growth-arrest-specific micro-tubule binding-domain-containing protein [Monoraphidium minutum]
MAPKKKPVKAKEKKDKKASGKDAAPGGAGGAGGDVEGASIEELNQKVVTLEREKNKEEEYRNYMQLERDKINAFWEINKKDLEDRRADLRNKDREMEEMEERHVVEVYKQKVKHLLFEHQNNIATLKADGELALKLQQDDFRRREGALGKDKRALKRGIKEQDVSHQELVRALRLDAAKEGSKARQEFELAARELAAKHERRLKMARGELELRRKQELHEVEERKNTHINDLMKQHEAAFAEVKGYYSDVTANNLDLIKALKEDVAEMKKREAQNEKLMYEIAQENKRLSEPLARSLKEVESLRGQLAAYDKDKASLEAAKARLAAAEKRVKALEWEGEVLTQRLESVSAERDATQARLEAGVYDTQQKTGLKSLLLERRVEALSGALELKEAQLGEVLAAAHMDPAALQQVSGRLEEVLSLKNATIRALQYDVAKVSKAHNDLIRVYEAKLAQFGVPPEELGFRPLVTSTALGPAGLVSGQ